MPRVTNRPNYPAHLILQVNNGKVLAEYALNKSEITVGREPNRDIVLTKDRLASRHHATIRYENGYYVLYDEHSLNGTSVNEQQLAQMTPYVLQDGDCIGISEHELIFHAYALPSANIKDLPTPDVPLASSETKPGMRSIGYAAVIKNGSALPSSAGRLTATLDTSSQKAPSFRKPNVHYSDLSFPDCIVVGRMEALRVTITRNSFKSQAVSRLLQPSADKDQSMEVDAHVVFSPLDFDLDGPNVATMLVSTDADSTPALFKLTPKTEGRKTLAVEFFQHARFLEKRELETIVVTQKTQLPIHAAAQTMLEARNAQFPLALTVPNRFFPDDLNYFYRSSLREKLKIIILLLFTSWRS